MIRIVSPVLPRVIAKEATVGTIAKIAIGNSSPANNASTNVAIAAPLIVSTFTPGFISKDKNDRSASAIRSSRVRANMVEG